MQNVDGFPGAGPADLPIKILLGPAREHLRLGLWQVGLHREIRARQIDSLLQIHVGKIHFGGFLYYTARGKIRRKMPVTKTLRRRTALDQVSNAAEKLGIVHYIKQPAPAVLTAVAVRSRKRSLLVHVPENRIGVRTRGNADFGVIAATVRDSLETYRLSVPRSGCRDFDRPWFTQRRVPASRRHRGRRRNIRRGPPCL